MLIGYRDSIPLSRLPCVHPPCALSSFTAQPRYQSNCSSISDGLRSGFALEQSFTAPLPCRHRLTIPLDRPETPAPVRLCTATGNYRFEHHEGMMNSAEQQFLKALDDKLWKAADKLRANLDAANYKHVVLGLIFLKYRSEEHTSELQSRPH